MYEIKGLREVFERNIPDAMLTKHEYAKRKILFPDKYSFNSEFEDCSYLGDVNARFKGSSVGGLWLDVYYTIINYQISDSFHKTYKNCIRSDNSRFSVICDGRFKDGEENQESNKDIINYIFKCVNSIISNYISVSDLVFTDGDLKIYYCRDGYRFQGVLPKDRSVRVAFLTSLLVMRGDMVENIICFYWSKYDGILSVMDVADRIKSGFDGVKVSKVEEGYLVKLIHPVDSLSSELILGYGENEAKLVSVDGKPSKSLKY